VSLWTTGFCERGEREAVEALYKRNFKIDLRVVDASRLFLRRLKGVVDPEKKRKIIGNTFVEVFERVAQADRIREVFGPRDSLP
jgi:GMP synthase (glutamine-hydrolysing)